MQLARTRTRRWAPIAVAVAVLAALAGCGSGGADAGAKDAVTVAIAAPFRSLDPLMDSSALPLQKSIFDQLVEIDAKGALQPGLALSWTSNPGATSWTFVLRKGVTFQDGSPLTAQDVAFSIQRVKDTPTSTIRANTAAITTVTAVDDATVRFDLNRPFGWFPRQVSVFSIVPKATYDPARFATAPIGSGPYRVVSWSSGRPAVLARYDGYWGPKPAFATVTVAPTPAADTRLTGLQSGQFDLAALETAQAGTAGGDTDLTVSSTPSNFVAYLGFNTTQAPLDNVLLRQAVDHAIDRDAIVASLYRGKAKPVGQMVAPVTFGYDPALAPTTFNPALARSLVARSGYTGTPIRLDYPDDGELQNVNNLAQAVQSQLKDVGITVELNGRPSTAFVPDWLHKQLPGAYLFSWRPSLLDAGQVLALSFRQAAMGYPTDPAMEQLVSASDAATDPTKRAALIAQVFTRAHDQAYFAPIFDDEYTVGLDSAVAYTPRADGLIIPSEIRRAG